MRTNITFYYKKTLIIVKIKNEKLFAIFGCMNTVIDIETTGGSNNSGKITEIAIFVFDGEKITDSFVTLVNPECYIPPFISNLTGITNEMVAHAPKFYEIARKIVEITANKIFVALL